MSDDIDDFFEKMKKMFNFNSDIMDIDFFLFPTDKPEANFDPEEIKSKGFKVSYHYDSSMDKPEIKVEGDIDNDKLKEYLKNVDLNKLKKFKSTNFTPKTAELDATGFTLEPTEHTHGLNVSEPYSEVNNFDNFSEIILEVPGAEEEDIFLHFDKLGERLTVTAHNPTHRYHKIIDLPFKSSLDNVTLDVKNGIAIIKVIRPV